MRQEHDDSLLLEPKGNADRKTELEEIWDIRKHFEKEQEGLVKSCDVCSKEVLCEDQLEEHKEMQHANLQENRNDISVINKLVQEICEKRLRPNVKIEEHIIIEDIIKEYSVSLKSCEVCSNEFHCEDKLLQHKEKHHVHEQESIVVTNQALVKLRDLCGKGFQYDEKFGDHIRNEHSTVGKNCDLCDKQFNQESLLTKHMTIDHGLGVKKM